MGHRVGGVQAPAEETQGVNDRWQLALAERELRIRTNRHWLLNGVTMLDPRQTFIDVTVQLGRDVTLYPGTILRATRSSATAARSGPTPGSTTAWSARDCRVAAHRRRRGRGRRRRPRRAVRPPAGRGRTSPGGRTTGAFYTAPYGLRRRGARSARWRRSPPRGWRSTPGGPTPSSPRRSAEHLGIELGHPNIVEFANGEVRPRFGESVRGTDVFIMQTHYGIDGRSHQRLDHGAADHDRRRLPGVGQAHHRGHARSTATPARTARPRAASRSRPASSPTCSRPPAPSG